MFTFGASLLVWYAVKLAIGIRVSPEEEEEGLDIGEHGMHAYDIPLGGGRHALGAGGGAVLAMTGAATLAPRETTG
jgi:Amt family ammonium transporter